LELVAVVTAVVFERPAAVLITLGSARVLEHPVDRHELRHHQLAHDHAPFRNSCLAPRSRPFAADIRSHTLPTKTRHRKGHLPTRFLDRTVDGSTNRRPTGRRAAAC